MAVPTTKQMAAQSRRNIANAVRNLRAIGARYGDVDNYIVEVADRYADALRAFGIEISEIAAECEGRA